MTKNLKCQVTGVLFPISPFEQELRAGLNMPDPRVSPAITFRTLLAFWHHFHLHQRTCDRTGQKIISVYRPNCPYPVWTKEVWSAEANPPQAEYSFHGAPFFEQLWDLFRRCPIPHNFGFGNENCDYTDDWWHSKDCYLCHSGVECRDCHYCYRMLKCLDCQSCVFTFSSELCRDLVNCSRCYRTLYSFYSRDCRDSAFLFDCRRCSNCLFCWNLRDKQYCIANQQLSKEEFERQRAQYDFRSWTQYEQARQHFEHLLSSQAFWRAQEIDKSDDSRGAYLENTKRCEDCYFISDSEDCARLLRGAALKNCVDVTGLGWSELVVNSSLIMTKSYDVRCSYFLTESSYMEYCAFCERCKNCFGCCGLVGKQYHIFNRPYDAEEYQKLVSRIKAELIQQGVYGDFFPLSFSPAPYEETLAHYFFPLTLEEQTRIGARTAPALERSSARGLPLSTLPDNSSNASSELIDQVFWDAETNRPVRITRHDLEFASKLGVPLPHGFYMQRCKDLYRWMFFDGTLRETQCAKSGAPILTHLPEFLDSRIIANTVHESLLA